jgi:hypothetical protein
VGRFLVLVDVIGRYSKPRPREKDLDKLQHLLERATRNPNAQPATTDAKIRNITRRLGHERIKELVADYDSNLTTITLMSKYQLSKTSVIYLLEANGVTLRRQGLTEDQVATAVSLYKDHSLTELTRQLRLPRESIRRALIDAGVEMRSRGGTKRAGS